MDGEDFDKGKVMARVRKMMALANDAAASEGERDNAMRMAHATLAKYNLSMAEAEAAGEVVQEKRGPGTLQTRSRPWIRQCGGAIARLFFCEYFYIKTGQNHMKSYFVGKESNVLTAIEITQYVVQSILKEGAARAKVEGFGHEVAWRVSFQKGATERVVARCYQLRADAEKASKPAVSTGTSLVLASVYESERKANELVIKDELKIKLVTAKSRETAPGDGYHAGLEYGDKVGLHRQVGGKPNDRKQIT